MRRETKAASTAVRGAPPRLASSSRSARPLLKLGGVGTSAGSRGSIDNEQDSTSLRSFRNAVSHSPAGACTSSSNTPRTARPCTAGPPKLPKTRCAVSVPRNARSGNKLGPQSAVSQVHAGLRAEEEQCRRHRPDCRCWCKAAVGAGQLVAPRPPGWHRAHEKPLPRPHHEHPIAATCRKLCRQRPSERSPRRDAARDRVAHKPQLRHRTKSRVFGGAADWGPNTAKGRLAGSLFRGSSDDLPSCSIFLVADGARIRSPRCFQRGKQRKRHRFDGQPAKADVVELRSGGDRSQARTQRGVS